MGLMLLGERRRRSRYLVLVTGVVILAVLGLGSVEARAATPSSLAGETFTSHGVKGSTVTGTCTGDPTDNPNEGSFNFTVSGAAAGPFPGTFTESGSFSTSRSGYLTDFSSTFTITSPAGSVTGTKTLAKGSVTKAICTLIEPGTIDLDTSNVSTTYTATIPGVGQDTGSATTVIRGILGLGPSFSEDFGSAGAPKPHVCSGSFTKPGVLKGAYPDGVVVKGVCFVNDGKARVTGTLTVTNGSVLAAAFGEHHSSLTVTRNLVVDRRAVAVLGCKVNANGTGQACLDDHSKHPTLTSHERVSGNIIANHALGLIVHNSAIGHGIKDIGGGGGATCAVPKTGIFAAFKSPVFSDLEDSTIGGAVVMNGLRTCWFGLARDTVRGYVTININKTADPDAIEVLANHIGKSLSCAGNRHPGIPASVGAFPIWDSADATESGLYPRTSEPNTVGGSRSGQCVKASPIKKGGPPAAPHF